MEERSYQEVSDLITTLDPWIEWFISVEGSELGDMVQALEASVGACTSAQENGFAYEILAFLRDYFKRAVEEDWLGEIVEMADESYERRLEDYSDSKQQELRQRRPKPSEALAKLPKL